MATYGLPIVATVLVWWFSTGAILYLDGLPRRTHRWSFGAASLVALAALWGLAATAGETGVAAAYLAVLCALLVWGWNEMAFLLGFVTGSRREASRPAAQGFARFRDASATVIYHELALAGSLAVIAWLTWGSANPFGLAAFALLFGMRLSTKLNIFLGVRNATVEFLPTHLAYLKSYFRRRSMNPLFPVSVTLATIATVLLGYEAAAAGHPFLATGLTLLAALAALGLLEHWFLVVPLPVARLWSWGLRSHEVVPASHRPLPPPSSRRAPESMAAHVVSSKAPIVSRPAVP